MRAKYFIAGVLVGTITMAAIPVLADNERVVALIDRTIKLEIAGEIKTLPEGYEILTYNNRTYLPSRYVAEELGCTVNWSEASRWITISDPPVKEVEKIVEVPKEVIKEVYVDRDTSYAYLPTNVTRDNITLTVQSIYRRSSYNAGVGMTGVVVRVKNSDSDRIIVDYAEAVLTAGGKSLRADTGQWDNVLAGSDIEEGKEVTGTFYFSLVEAGTDNFILTVPIRNQVTGTTSALTARFTATLAED